MWHLFLFLMFCPFLAAMPCGCQRPPSQSDASDIPVVPVAEPMTRNVTPYVDFTGRTDAVEVVNVVARVTGYSSFLRPKSALGVTTSRNASTPSLFWVKKTRSAVWHGKPLNHSTLSTLELKEALLSITCRLSLGGCLSVKGWPEACWNRIRPKTFHKFAQFLANS